MSRSNNTQWDESEYRGNGNDQPRELWISAFGVQLLVCCAFSNGRRWYVDDCDGTIEIRAGPLFV